MSALCEIVTVFFLPRYLVAAEGLEDAQVWKPDIRQAAMEYAHSWYTVAKNNPSPLLSLSPCVSKTHRLQQWKCGNTARFFQ